MRLYFEKFVRPKEVVLAEVLSTLIRNIHASPTPVITCHEVAEAVALEFNMQRLCGYYGGVVEHSWCENAFSHWYDVYPVGILPAPLLLDGKAIHNQRIYEIRQPQPLFSVRNDVVDHIRDGFRESLALRR